MSEVAKAIIDCNRLIDRSKQIMEERFEIGTLTDEDYVRIKEKMQLPTFLSLSYYDAWKLLNEINHLRAKIASTSLETK